MTEDMLRAGLGRGERRAREALFLAYASLVRRLIHQRARHLSSSELSDEVQDVFLALMSRRIQVRSSIEGYVVRATLNHCASRARHWAVARRGREALEREADVARGADVAPSVTRHDLALVHRYLESNAEAREVYELMYVEGFGRPEIARRKNWPERYTRTRMRRLHDGLGAFVASAVRVAAVPAAAS